jgi:hypothetical protein
MPARRRVPGNLPGMRLPAWRALLEIGRTHPTTAPALLSESAGGLGVLSCGRWLRQRRAGPRARTGAVLRPPRRTREAARPRPGGRWGAGRDAPERAVPGPAPAPAMQANAKAGPPARSAVRRRAQPYWPQCAGSPSPHSLFRAARRRYLPGRGPCCTQSTPAPVSSMKAAACSSASGRPSRASHRRSRSAP